MPVRRKVIAGAAALAVFAAVLGLAQSSNKTDMDLLYAGLDSAAAGEVIAALQQQGAAYEVRGPAIYVDAARRDSLRMELAAQNLPASGSGGYELLDGLSGFSTTSQMFDATYWRAREGELARTILATPGVKSARVHIAQSRAAPFRRAERATASVTVTTAAGSLTDARVRAFRHLIASSVPGMTPEDVSVIDTALGLMRSNSDTGPGAGQSEDRAADLRRNVERLLEARVGAGRAVVEVSLEYSQDREQITERRFDPESRVAISTDTQEKTSNSSDSPPEVTVASNLPDGDAGAGAQNQSQAAETREKVNYEVSQTQRDFLRGPGALQRMTVAVLVDGLTSVDANGAPVWQPRPEEELTALRDLVASAVGLNEQRGDVLTLRSLAFEKPAETGSLAEAGMFGAFADLDVMSLIKIAVLALVAMILGLFVVRPILTSQARRELAGAGMPLALPGGDAQTGAPRVITGEIADADQFDDGNVVSGTAEEVADDPVERLRRLIDARQAESVQVLQGWLEHEEERN